jgi:hypothetical protein
MDWRLYYVRIWWDCDVRGSTKFICGMPPGMKVRCLWLVSSNGSGGAKIFQLDMYSSKLFLNQHNYIFFIAATTSPINYSHYTNMEEIVIHLYISLFDAIQWWFNVFNGLGWFKNPSLCILYQCTLLFFLFYFNRNICMFISWGGI